MAEGYSDIAHSSYAEWKVNTLGRAFDLDGSYGCQCWDYASLFWRNVGFPAGYPLTGPNSYASECWTVNRNANASYNGTDYFELINSLTDVKQGDIIVLNGNSSNPPGHIAFADEDYDGTGYIWCIGQNQGGTVLPGGGTAVTRNHLGTSDFLGAFRYKDWVSPTPTLTYHKFPWFIYANKLRNRNNVI